MTKLRKIGITQRIIFADKGAPKDALEQDYIQYYEKFGLVLVPIPNVLHNISDYLDALGLDGFILSGGNDVNPSLYGAKSAPDTKYADDRDKTDYAILEYAIAKKLPVLCECRGTQLLNVFFKGKLCDIKSTIKNPVGHVATTHSIKLSAIPAKYIGKQNIDVNSYHNQGFEDSMIGSQLKSFAVASDGVIEGIYHSSHRIAGIMWHPERETQVNVYNDLLIKAFVQGELFWR